MSHASKVGTPSVRRPASGKRRPYSARPAGMRGKQPKFTLFDPENRKSPITVTNTKFRRGKSKVEKLREEVQQQVKDLEAKDDDNDYDYDDDDGGYGDDDDFEKDGEGDKVIEGLSEQVSY